ncbi:MAG: tRNA lysidine(34) synthetase TilS [Candidatus Algichlamydia australiensis]|nr:tRNA lysidine(34) synthetase TilS [Chlamydiales bacterium]
MKENPVIPFLRKQWNQKSPLLLGFSGGPDSMALLHMLLKVKIPLHLAHVDHGMREEGEKEAQLLAGYADKLGLPFHLRTLRGISGRNLEERFRDERRKFFIELTEKFSFQALLLGHHADDQAEVVLKRILEGARLYNLGGMAPVSKQEKLTIWRPLLGMRKEVLIKFLHYKGVHAFEDRTNSNLHYLRARMRAEIFPYLEKKFGKQVRMSLCRLAEESRGEKERLRMAYALEQEGKKSNSEQLRQILRSACTKE